MSYPNIINKLMMKETRLTGVKREKKQNTRSHLEQKIYLQNKRTRSNHSLLFWMNL